MTTIAWAMWPGYLAIVLIALGLTWLAFSTLRLSNRQVKPAIAFVVKTAGLMAIPLAVGHILSLGMYVATADEAWKWAGFAFLLAGAFVMLVIFACAFYLRRVTLAHLLHPFRGGEDPRRQLQNLLDRLPDIIFSLDSEKRIISINAALHTVLGYKTEEVIGRSIEEFIDPAQIGELQLRWTEYEQGDEKLAIPPPFTVYSRFGEPVLLSVMLSARRDEAGKLVAVDGIARDIRAQQALEDAIRAHAGRMESLFNMALALGTTLDLSDLLDRLMRIAQEAIGYDSANILIRKEGRFQVVAWRGYSEEAVPSQWDYEEFAAPHLEIIRLTHQPLIIPDTARDPSWIYTADAPYIRSWLGAPLFVRDELIGIINLDSRQPNRYTQADAQLLATIASQAAIFIDNIQLLEKWKRSSSALDNLIASSMDAVIALNQHKMITTWNPAAERILGYPSSTTLGRPLAKCDATGRLLAIERIADRALAGERVQIPEFSFDRPDGRRVYLRADVAPIYDEHGAITGALLTARDVTQERVSKRQLEQSEKLSALGQVVAGVAHELNNPLTSVIGYAQLLRNQSLPEEVLQDLDKVIAQAKRAARIVHNLLTFAGDHEVMRVPTNVNDVIAQVLDMRMYQLRAQNIQVHLDLAPDLPATLADAHQLEQVFLNLVLNAEQAMVEAHGRGNLSIRTQVLSGPRIRVEVQDDGPGISPENLKRIFDPFFTTKQVGKGTGLGLSVCYGIIEEHEGRIWAESIPGEGATFYVELPVIGLVKLSDTISAPAPAGAEADRSLIRPRILVVDDEESIRSMLARALPQWGYQVLIAGQVDEAFKLIERDSPDLILTDVWMQGGEGGEVLLDRVQERWPALADRFIFISGDTTPEKIVKRLAGRPILYKPFELSELHMFLRQSLASKMATSPSAG